MTKARKLTIWVMGTIGMLLSLFMAFVEFSEVYRVTATDVKYPWGPVNNNPWYYANERVYLIYALVSGLIFLLTGLFTLRSTLKRNLKGTLIGFVITVLTFSLVLISATITTPIL